MDAVKAILERSEIGSFDAMGPDEQYSVSIEGNGELVFEKTGPARLSVSHRRTRQGHTKRIQGVSFRIEGDAWIPIEYTRAPAVRRYDATGLDVSEALRTWEERLHQQGCIGATEEPPRRDQLRRSTRTDRKPEHI